MTGFLLRRLAISALLLLLVLILTFGLLQIAPGDATAEFSNPGMSPEAMDNLRRVFGLDRPPAEQFLSWIRSVVLHWDWGVSLATGRSVAGMLADAIPNTFLLGLAAMAVNLGIGVPVGIYGARHHGRLGDHVAQTLTLLLYSVPIFWLGLIAIVFFSYVWPILPPGHALSPLADQMGRFERWLDLVWHLVLPAGVLGIALAGETARFVRGSLLEILDLDYIRTARAKGLSERRVTWVHALRNAVVPVIQLAGVTLPSLLNGSLILEIVFSRPGLGRLALFAVERRDWPVILAATAFSGFLIITGNLLADLLHAAADPRIRHA